MRFIIVKKGIVRGVRYGTKAVGQEIESETGEIGQRMLDDGTFEDVIVEKPTTEPQPTTDERLEIIELSVAQTQTQVDYLAFMAEISTMKGGEK